MSEYRTILERARNEFPAPEMSLDSLLHRLERRRRSKQVRALIFTLALLAIVVGGAVSVLRSSERRIPAVTSETPTPAPGELVRPQDLDERFDVAAAWGEVDGVAWTTWSNDDLSCVAFTSASGGNEGLDIDNCANGYDGNDLTLAGICVYSCPVPERPILYGTVSRRVATVELAVDDGSTYTGTIHPMPPGITVDARVFTVLVPLRWGSYTGWLTATGADGAVLGQVRYPENADAAAGASMPITVEARLASGVPVSKIDGRPSERDRWTIAVWRNAADAWCFGTIYPYFPSAVVASEGPGCVARERLFEGIRTGAIDHEDVWWIEVSAMFGEQGRWFAYRASGTASDEVAAVRIEVDDGSVVGAELNDPPPGFEDMGRLFVAEFRSKHHPWEFGGEGGIAWYAITLDANGEVLGSDEVSL